MHDYYESPLFTKVEYSPFLVRLPQNFTADLLKRIHQEISSKDLILSIERLFKGSKSALVLYGPREILLKFNAELNLLELEDYTSVNKDHIQSWEIGPKDPKNFQVSPNTSVFKSLPPLLDSEQFWWQMTLQPTSKEAVKNNKVKSLYSLVISKSASQTDQKFFQGQIRAVFLSEDTSRRLKIATALQDLLDGQLVKLPRPFTGGLIFESYKQRSLAVGQSVLLTFSSEDWVNMSKLHS